MGEEAVPEAVEQGDAGELPDALAVTRELDTSDLDVAIDVRCEEHRPDRLIVLGVGASHAGDAQTDVGAQHPSSTARHLGRGGLGDHRSFGDSEQVELHL